MKEDLTLASIKAMLEAATPGPWKRVGYPPTAVAKEPANNWPKYAVADCAIWGGTETQREEANAALIAAAPPPRTPSAETGGGATRVLLRWRGIPRRAGALHDHPDRQGHDGQRPLSTH